MSLLALSKEHNPEVRTEICHRFLPVLGGRPREDGRELGREKQRYEAAISKLRAAREALVDVATLASWLGSGDIGEASTTLPFSRTLEELRLDCEQLAAHPDTPDGPQGEPGIDIGRLRDAGAAASLWVGR